MEKKTLGYLKENSVLIFLSLFKFLLLIFFAGNYGLFRDEYYYLECSKHLSFGYVDQPPLSILLLAVSRTLFGESIIGIRIFAYIAGSATVYFSGLLARELGGGKFAQSLTAITVIFSGVVLGTSGYYSMNVFDILIATLLFYYIIRLINTDNPQIWLVIGMLFGIGLQNKLTPLFIGFGLAAGFLLTNERKQFRRKEIYLGALIAFLIFLPHLIWQFANGFPTLEFMRNAAMHKNQPMSMLEFSKNAAFELNPGFVIFIATGLYFFLFNEAGRKYRFIAVLFFTVFLVFVFNNGKPYYMGVLYTVMLAAGAVGADFLITRYLKNWVRFPLLLFVFPSIILVTPFALPVLSTDSFIKFSEFIGIKPGVGERSEQGILPQFYADRFGWKEMVAKTAEVYNRLSAGEKGKVVIIAQNYGEAGAVDYYGKEYGLPKAYSFHNSYWLWGPPENWDGSVAIVVGLNKEYCGEFFEEVELAAVHRNKYGMPYENVKIFLCRKTKMSANKIWKRVKVFI